MQHPLRIALVGASGSVGSRIAAEATRRGHRVTPLGRAQLDVFDAAQVAAAAAGHDVLVSAYRPPEDEPQALVVATRALLAGAQKADVARIVAVGGAGSALLPSGKGLAESAPADDPYRAIGLAHRDALRVFQASDAPWTVLTPSGNLFPGERTGTFRLSGDILLVDAHGDPKISMEDYAVAFVDELETGAHIGERFTVGY